MEILIGRVRRLAGVALLAAGVVVAGRAAAAQRALEYEVKAAYLANFLQFVEWPSDALGPAGTPAQVCIVGADPFGQVLDRTMEQESVAGHPVQIKRMRDASNAAGCRVVFVAGASGARVVPAALRAAPGALVIAESARALEEGAHINFVVAAGRVRFDLNLTTARNSGIRISSKLVRVARMTRGGPEAR